MTATAPPAPVQETQSGPDGSSRNGSDVQRLRSRLASAWRRVVAVTGRIVSFVRWAYRLLGKTPFQKIRRSILFLYFVATAGHYWRGGEIRIEPLSVPASLASLGVSGHELTARLIDHVDSLREAARLTSGETKWIMDTPSQHPNIDVPWLGIPLSE